MCYNCYKACKGCLALKKAQSASGRKRVESGLQCIVCYMRQAKRTMREKNFAKKQKAAIDRAIRERHEEVPSTPKHGVRADMSRYSIVILLSTFF